MSIGNIDAIKEFGAKVSRPITVYCRGTKKNGTPCKRYLGKVEGKAELLCPICKAMNMVESGNITITENQSF